MARRTIHGESEMKNKVECLHCGELCDISNVIESIGHLKGMKTKSFNCEKCGKLTNYSVNVGYSNPLLKAILGQDTSKD